MTGTERAPLGGLKDVKLLVPRSKQINAAAATFEPINGLVWECLAIKKALEGAQERCRAHEPATHCSDLLQPLVAWHFLTE